MSAWPPWSALQEELEQLCLEDPEELIHFQIELLTRLSTAFELMLTQFVHVCTIYAWMHVFILLFAFHGSICFCHILGCREVIQGFTIICRNFNKPLNAQNQNKFFISSKQGYLTLHSLVFQIGCDAFWPLGHLNVAVLCVCVCAGVKSRSSMAEPAWSDCRMLWMEV